MVRHDVRSLSLSLPAATLGPMAVPALIEPAKAWRLTPITPTGHARWWLAEPLLETDRGLKYSKVVWPEVHCSARESTTTRTTAVVRLPDGYADHSLRSRSASTVAGRVEAVRVLAEQAPEGCCAPCKLVR